MAEPIYWVVGDAVPIYEVDPCPEGDTIDEEAALICAIAASNYPLSYDEIAHHLKLSEVAVERAHEALLSAIEASLDTDGPLYLDDAEAASALLSGVWV